MAGKDTSAGHLLKGLREQRRLMPEQVPHAMLSAGVDRRYVPSARTIRRAEQGHRLTLRVEFGLADFYGRERHHIWKHAQVPLATAVPA